MAAKRKQLRAWVLGGTGLGGDLGVRMRSTVFALLGLTTAACLVVVAILVHQGVPFLPALPLPGVAAGDERVGAAEPVARANPVVALAGERLASAAAAAAPGPASRDTGREIEAQDAVPPGPSSAVAQPVSGDPVATPVPVSEPPADGGGQAPAPSPAPSPSPASGGAPSVTTTSSPTDAQLVKGKSNKGGSSKHSSSGRGESGTDAAVPSTKKAPAAPVSTTAVPPMTDAEPEPATDADPDHGNGHGHRH